MNVIQCMMKLALMLKISTLQKSKIQFISEHLNAGQALIASSFIMYISQGIHIPV